ncbi:hypothetical protein AAZX31_18G084900 [Glycine max]
MHGSQSYTVEELLKDMLHKLCKEKLETPLHNDSLIYEVRNHLRQKRYVVLFHEVWDKKFSDGIDFAIIDKNSDTEVSITTSDRGCGVLSDNFLHSGV